MVVLILVLTLVSDRLTKIYFSNALSAGDSIPVIKGIFYLTLVHNRGGAFGILKNQVSFLSWCQ